MLCPGCCASAGQASRGLHQRCAAPARTRVAPAPFPSAPARALLDWRLLRRGSPVAQPRIATLTMNPALDLSTAADRVLPEHKLRCEQPRYHPGGGGINVARAVVRLGGDAVAVYPAGGPPGDLIDLLMEQEQVPRHVVGVPGWTRESITVREQSTGAHFRFVLPGTRADRRSPGGVPGCPGLARPRARRSSWSAAACRRAPRPTCSSGSRPGAPIAARAWWSTCPERRCSACAGQR